MKYQRLAVIVMLCCSGSITVASYHPREFASSALAGITLRSFNPDFMSPEELKARFANGKQVTVIDVRNTSGYVAGSNKIKGAIHVKLRRLAYRLSFAPLKNVPRDSEVVTYCACPSDEASIRAAEILVAAGFKRVYVLKGGWDNWLKANGPVESRPRG